MNLLAEILSIFVRRNSKYPDAKSKYVFYKIVDLVNENDFALQCINTNALFYGNITDIVFDTDILHGLHPIQSCFIGIEYAKYIKKNEPNLKVANVNQKMNQHAINRYGCYTLCYQNRNGELYFINNITNEQYVMDPRDIALSEEFITEFDATQAFYIGLLAGLKINNAAKQNADYKRSNLYLVK